MAGETYLGATVKPGEQPEMPAWGGKVIVAAQAVSGRQLQRAGAEITPPQLQGCVRCRVRALPGGVPRPGVATPNTISAPKTGAYLKACRQATPPHKAARNTLTARVDTAGIDPMGTGN